MNTKLRLKTFPAEQDFSEMNQITLPLFPLANYSFGDKDPQHDQQTGENVSQRMLALKKDFETSGLRITVEAAIIVHEHDCPHILLLSAGGTYFTLPGGVLSPGQDEKSGLLQHLHRLMSPIGEESQFEFDIDEIIGCFYRPNFTNAMYPYLPTHIKRPKEVIKTFVVHLPEKAYISIPSNYKIIAVPLFELYGSPEKYGERLAAIPHILSRYNFIFQ
jgi:cleavage and polyadenylation specificity factor subunit 5